MPASISTRLDEQEFLELADFYYTSADNPSRTASTITLSTNHTHLRRRAATPGPRWRPSTLIECDDSGHANSHAPSHYGFVEAQTVIIDPRASFATSLLDYDSDDTQSFRTAKDHDLHKPTIETLNAVRPPSAIPTRPISTASLVPGSCFGLVSFPRWIMKGFYPSSGFRLRKRQKVPAAESIKLGVGETFGSRHNFSIIPLNSGQSGQECSTSTPSRGLASASSPFIGLDYDYHLAVEVLINGSNDDQDDDALK